MPKLVIVEGNDIGGQLDLDETTVIGRAQDAQIVLKESSVSRYHARIILADGAHTIEDLDSRNGTCVNGDKIEISPIEEGSKIGIGTSVFVFKEDDQGTTQEEPAKNLELGDEAASTIHSTVHVNPTDTTKLDELLRLVTPDDARRIHHRLKTIYEVSRDISSILKLDKLLNRIMDRLFDVFPEAERGFILLKEADGKTLKRKAAKSKIESDERPIISRTVVSSAMQKHQAILCSDPMSDERFKDIESFHESRTQSMMCAPLLSRNDSLGIIIIDSTSKRDAFSQDDLDLLSGIGGELAVAIENARMHEAVLEKRRVERDLRIAAEVQRNFLPQALPQVAGYKLAAHLRSAMAVGGDFYDFIELPDNRLGVAIGDVSGKGVSAALLMARITNHIRLLAANTPEPKTVLQKLNDEMFRWNMPEQFITMIYACVDLNTNRLVLANAGHLSPILLRGAEKKLATMQKVRDYPIGVEKTPFSQGQLQLEKGDVVALLTDGVTEARDQSGAMYGTDRLKATMKQNVQSAEQTLSDILSDLENFQGDAPQSDDVTIVCFGPVEA